MKFKFGEYTTEVIFSREITEIKEVSGENALVICDENTKVIADKICGCQKPARCILKSGEDSKTWESVQAVLSCAQKAGLGRDGVFIGVGGGVIGDLAGFASSIYMRGSGFVLVSTTLLGMVDASVGGKTGFDLFGIKNMAGSFYPAQNVYIPFDCLSSLAEKEIKSGISELIKTAVLDGDAFLDELEEIAGRCNFKFTGFIADKSIGKCIEKAVTYKGNIVQKDPKETGSLRKLLNLGHTFGHALEAVAGLGNLSHGEAVAWGMIRSCELGYALGITPRARAEKIIKLTASFGYELKSPHPLAGNTDMIINAMRSDKKKKDGKLNFIVPDTKSARSVIIESDNDKKTVMNIINGDFKF